MSIPYIKIYPSDMRALTSRLDKEQKLFIYEAIEDYGIFGVWPELCNGNAIAMRDFENAYNLIKNKIEAETQNYKEKTEKMAQNAKKRWSTDESKSNANAKQKQSKSNAKAMLTKNQEPVTSIISPTPFEKELGFIENSVFKEIMRTWLKYKKDEHKETYKSQTTLEACYKNLLELSKGDGAAAQQIINQSIANKWKGLFELKTGFKAKQSANALPSPADKYNVE